MRVSLVPAYEPCTSPNREHGPPLAHPSCNPPVAGVAHSSRSAAPDANGEPASSIGSVTLRGASRATRRRPRTRPTCARRCRSPTCATARDAADYTGELQARTTAAHRPTAGATATATGHAEDRAAGHGPVRADARPLAGAHLLGRDHARRAHPGLVAEGARAVWELGQVEVLDGGPDGDVDTPGNTVFARQGIFIPVKPCCTRAE